MRARARNVLEVDAAFASQPSHKRRGTDPVLLANHLTRSWSWRRCRCATYDAEPFSVRSVVGLDYHQDVTKMRGVSFSEARLEHPTRYRRRQLNGGLGGLHLQQRLK